MGQMRPGDLDGRFAMTVNRESAHLSALSSQERNLLDKLAGGPKALDELVETRVQVTVLNRLVARPDRRV